LPRGTATSSSCSTCPMSWWPRGRVMPITCAILPSAANTGAWLARFATSSLGPDMALDVLHLLRPAAFVPAEGFQAKVPGELVETGLNKAKQRAVLGVL